MPNDSKNGNGTATFIRKYWPIITTILIAAMGLGALQVQVSINKETTQKNLPICQFVEFQRGLDRQLSSIDTTLREINRKLDRRDFGPDK